MTREDEKQTCKHGVPTDEYCEQCFDEKTEAITHCIHGLPIETYCEKCARGEA